MAIRSIVVLSLLALVASCPSCKEACANKVLQDPCDYLTTSTTECSVVNDEKFCRKATGPEHSVPSECTIHSQQGYLGCFSNAQYDPVFQVCVGATAGSECLYETPAHSGHRRRETPRAAKNTSANCIAHYSHGILMCLESVGPVDHECEGKGVGHSCTHPDSSNAICTHHSRSGNWMCSAPKEERMVFVVCQGRDAGTPCSFTGSNQQDSGLIQGECCEQEGSVLTEHGQMMCHQLEDIGGSCLDVVAKDESSFPWTLVLLIAGGVLVIIVLTVGILCFRSHKVKARAPATATVVVGLPCGESEGNNKMQTV